MLTYLVTYGVATDLRERGDPFPLAILPIPRSGRLEGHASSSSFIDLFRAVISPLIHEASYLEERDVLLRKGGW
jgi:hypothetical protein